MAENIAGLFEQFSRIIPIAGEAITDFGESNALFAYAEGEEGCVTLTPETEKDRLVLQRAFLSLILNEFSPEQIGIVKPSIDRNLQHYVEQQIELLTK